MAVPKRKTSTSKRNMRRAHDHMSVSALSECPECGETVRPHHACGSCGKYRGREVLSVDED